VTRPSWYWWLAMLLSSMTTGAIALVVGLHANAESDRKWCSIVTTMVSSYDQQPPVTPAGKQLAADLRGLRDQLGCR
jgi:hypothetical protein